MAASTGYYINNDNKLIQCTSSSSCDINTGCERSYYLDESSKSNNAYSKVIYCSSNTSCSNETINNGCVINGASKSKVIVYSNSSYSSNDGSKSGETKYYLNVSTKDKSNNPLIKCNNGSACITMAASIGYYINNDNKLIQCTSSNSCIIINAEVGSYYLDEGSKSNNAYSKLIYCSSATSCTSGTINNGYVINGDNKKTLLTCSSNSCNSISGSQSNTTKYYLNVSSKDKSTNPLIKCNNGSACVTMAASIGYYINNDNKLIHCSSSSSCTIKDGGVGSYYLDEDSKSNNVYSKLIYCSGATSCTSTTISNGYVINGANKKNLIKCSGSNCNSINGSESNKTKYYLNESTNDKSSKPLISCKNGDSCETKVGESGTYYLNEDSKSTTGDTYSKVIYCSSATSCTSTTISNGYVINGANKKTLIKCSGNNCNSISGSESNKTKYYLNVSTYDKSSKPLILCNNGSDCETTAGGVGYYYLDESSKSSNGYSKVIYCSNTTSCTSTTISNGYVINGSNKKALINCSGNNCNSISGSESNKTKYYLNVSTYDKTNNPLINCDNGNDCVTTSGGTGYYYLDESSKSSNGYSKVIYCSGAKSCTSTTINNGYIINGANKVNLIKCSDNNCNSIVGSVSNKTKYYLNESTYDKSSKPLILCNNGAICETKVGVEGSYYLDEDGKSTSGDTYSKIIYCSGTTSCSNEAINSGYVINGANKINLIKCSGSSCQSIDASESDKNKYYLNVSIYDKSSKPLINCNNSNDCGTKEGEVGSYYLDEDSKSTAGDTYSKIIYCSSTTSCSNETIDYGYVINGANKIKLNVFWFKLQINWC